MKTFIYSFYKSSQGNLIIKGMYNIKYKQSEIDNGLVVYTSDEIETIKNVFVVDRLRTVKSGKAFINNKKIALRLKKLNFV
jgi:hypothetical protein